MIIQGSMCTNSTPSLYNYGAACTVAAMTVVHMNVPEPEVDTYEIGDNIHFLLCFSTVAFSLL